MANVVEYGRRSFTVTPDGVTDFDITETLFTNGIRLAAINFYPSAANDVLAVRDKTATGALIHKVKDVVGGGLREEINSSLRVRPYLKASDQTFGTAANVRIIFEYD